MKTKLEVLIKETGITKLEFSKISGISQDRVYKYCKGANIPLKKAVKIMECINIIRQEKSKMLEKRVSLNDLGHHTPSMSR